MPESTRSARATLLLEGHIIDSLMLPRLLDLVMDEGGAFSIDHLAVGQEKTDPSSARVTVTAASAALLDAIVKRARELGATVEHEQSVSLAEVTRDGVFPEGFYSTSNLPTEVLVDSRWLEVQGVEMDCAVAVDAAAERAWCVTFDSVRAGMKVVTGHAGVRIHPLERSRRTEVFSFMTSEVSIEKPKKRMIAEIAEEMRAARVAGDRILVVSGPAVVHTGAVPHLVRLIETGYVQAIFAGNALAAHDVEAQLFGTSLGVHLESGLPMESGHEHHMRAINRVRAAGGLRQMVEAGELSGGVMHAAITHGVELVLAGSVRDDGPIPDVISDMVAAQAAMRACVHRGVRLVLMLSTMLHSIATGNMLPAHVRTVCVDINPGVVTKLADRGSWQSVGLVTDVDSFLRELVTALA